VVIAVIKMEVPVARVSDNLSGSTTLFDEKKEAKVELEDVLDELPEVPLNFHSDTISGFSDEEFNIYRLSDKNGGIRQMSSIKRERSLISTLRYLHKGPRSTSANSIRDWGFLASRSRRRMFSCSPQTCSCFSSSNTHTLDNVNVSKVDEGFRQGIESKVRSMLDTHTWQEINSMIVDVAENNMSPKEFELYLYKQQISLYDGKVKPRYIVNLEDVESVSYLKDMLHNTASVRESQEPCTVKGIVLSVRERGNLEITCSSQFEVERLAVALRTNELMINDPIYEDKQRDHPMGPEEKKISAINFKNKIRSGDILLFKTDSISGKVIRKATSGEFDHIAIGFKFPSGKCGILESLQNTGVAAFLWEDLLKSKAYLEYKRVVMRPLILPPERKRKLLQKIERFVFEASQSKLNYGLGASKLMRKKSMTAEP